MNVSDNKKRFIPHVLIVWMRENCQLKYSEAWSLMVSCKATQSGLLGIQVWV